MVPTPAQAARAINAVAKTTVARRRSQKVKGSSLSIGTKVTAPTDGSVVATASGTVKIKGVKKRSSSPVRPRTLAGGQSATLKLRPKGAKKAARGSVPEDQEGHQKGVQVTATITIKIVDAAGNDARTSRVR